MKQVLACTLLAAAAGQAVADDEDALLLADLTPTEQSQAREWQLFVEAAAGRSALRDGAGRDLQRLSIDLYLDTAFASGWRGVLSNRLDVSQHNGPSGQNGANTLREAYVSWQMKPDQLFDVGRINARYGVAIGYNPTDYLRDGALRSVVSADPGSLRRNRLGTVMLRSQTLWEHGSFTVLYSPKLDSRSSHASLSPDLGATNNRHRWLLAASYRIGNGIAPQWLIYDAQGQSPQFGLNVALLLNQSTVGYLEWSGGRSRSLLSQALGGADDAFRNRVATGVTYTTPFKQTLTLEYQYNGTGLRPADWESLPSSPPAYGRYRQTVQRLQELPTRHALFAYATWQDVLIPRLHLSAMLRANADDNSSLKWLEMRYQWDASEAALQWQRHDGVASSEFGAAHQRQSLHLLYRHDF